MSLDATVVTAKPPRMPGLDAARALATLAMVVGHSADGLLSDSARALPWVQVYWTFRGLTAPLFLFVAGWAVVASVERGNRTGLELIRARLGRVALLFGFGVGLRWPGWDLSGLLSLHPDVWRHLIGFDALQVIGASLLLGIVVLAYLRTPRTRTVALAALAVFFPLASAAVWSWIDRLGAPLPIRVALVADAESPFAIFPWAGYFFCGALTGQLLSLLPGRGRKTLALAAVGALCIALCVALGLDNLPQTSPVLFSYRLGQVWIIASAAMALPLYFALPLASFGRSSLTVYVFHLPFVYGWSTFPGLNARFGHALSLGQVLAVAAVLLAAGLLVARAIRGGKKAWAARPRGKLPRPDAA